MTDEDIMTEIVQVWRKRIGKIPFLGSQHHVMLINVDDKVWTKVKKLTKKMTIGVTVHAVGHVDAVKLIHNYKQYKITLKEAFEACWNQKLDISMSLSFHKTKLDWMKQ